MGRNYERERESVCMREICKGKIKLEVGVHLHINRLSQQLTMVGYSCTQQKTKPMAGLNKDFVKD